MQSNRTPQFVQLINLYSEYSQMSNFDPNSFLDGTTTEASVKRPPLPVGDYRATVGEPKARPWQGKKDPTQSGIALDMVLEIDISSHPELVNVYGTDKVGVNDSIMLDTTAAGSIDYSPGKNARLRRYREATNLNTPGQAFAPRMLQGRMVMVRVKHEVYEGEVYDKIESVAKIA